MKKLLIILILFFSLKVFAQPVVQRANGSITVQDFRFYPKLNMVLPTFLDTASANAALGLNLAGAIIYSQSDAKFYIRKGIGGTAGIYWIEVGGGGSGTVTGAINGNTLVGANISWGGRLTGNTSVSGANLYNTTLDSMNNFTVNVKSGVTNQYILRQGSNIRVNVTNSSSKMLSPDLSHYIQIDNGQVYLSGTQKILMASKNADQYADDSLVWRIIDRSSFFYLTPGFAHIYGDDSVLLQSDAGIYRFSGLLSTIDTTTNKPAVFDINGNLKRGNSWAQGMPIPTLQQVYAKSNFAPVLTNSTLTDISNKNYQISGANIYNRFNDSANTTTLGAGVITLNPENPTATKGFFVNNLTIGGAADRLIVGNSSTGRVDFGSNGYGILFTSSVLLADTATLFPAVRATIPAGTVTWNGISNPTGDQALTFDAGESSTWTNSNTTEDLFTVNSSTITTSSFISLNSTSTTLASGNNLAEFIMSGVNGTNAITANPVKISVTNTNATSGSNTALDLTASGATTANLAINAIGSITFRNAAGTTTLTQNSPNSSLSWVTTVDNSNIIFNATGADALFRRSGSNIFTYSANAVTLTSGVGLTIGAGTTTVAPITLTTAAGITTPAAGKIEYTTPQLFFTNGGATRQEIPQIQQTRVSTQYDNTTTTLGNITGLTANLVAGKTYRFRAELFTTSNVAGGIKVAIAGTATVTAIIYEAMVTDAGVTTQGRTTTIATAVAGVTAVTASHVTITGLITVNAAGTLTCQAAQNANVGTTSILVGSQFVTTEML